MTLSFFHVAAVSAVHFFLLFTESCPIVGMPRTCGASLLLMDIWVGSSFACYKCSCYEHSCPSLSGPKFAFLWDKCLGGEWPDHMEGVCFTFEKAAKCFPKWLNHFTFPLTVEEGPRGGWGLAPRPSPLQSLHPSPPGPSVTAGLAP